jgi:hypothetical protein
MALDSAMFWAMRRRMPITGTSSSAHAPLA